IAVIGAGPAGLTTLKTLLERSKPGDSVVAFEARERLGGIWNPSPAVRGEIPFSPCYDYLHTNLPYAIMEYSDTAYPVDTPIFPPAATVWKYLDDYAEKFALKPHIHFNTTVKNMDWIATSKSWSVLLSTGETRSFEHVIVCSGHFRKPRYPEIPGLQPWVDNGKALHSAWYRNPDDFGTARRVLVVGDGASGVDITSDIARSPSVDMAIQSTLGKAHAGLGPPYSDRGNIVIKGPVARIDGDVVHFQDGTIDARIDACIVATGYQFSYPFINPKVLRSEDVTGFSPSTDPHLGLRNTSYSIFPLAKHIFPVGSLLPPTSLAFVGLLLRGSPFSTFEAQALAVAHAIEHPNALDMAQEIEDIDCRRKALAEINGEDNSYIATVWHRLSFDEGFVYRDSLFAFAGIDRRVEQWEKDVWHSLEELKIEWRARLRAGTAEERLRGIRE
ncbi:FAD/NAD(P)-binding domain-containing protein, partial [Fistulina hepatica ATCC 64428]